VPETIGLTVSICCGVAHFVREFHSLGTSSKTMSKFRQAAYTIATLAANIGCSPPCGAGDAMSFVPTFDKKPMLVRENLVYADNLSPHNIAWEAGARACEFKQTNSVSGIKYAGVVIDDSPIVSDGASIWLKKDDVVFAFSPKQMRFGTGKNRWPESVDIYIVLRDGEAYALTSPTAISDNRYASHQLEKFRKVWTQNHQTDFQPLSAIGDGLRTTCRIWNNQLVHNIRAWSATLG
jgi:hypothetical protein